MSRYREWEGEVVLPSRLYTVPALVKVAPDEVTCLSCGETLGASTRGCPRCSNKTDGVNFDKDGVKSFVETKTTPTISYLKEDEYYVAK